MLEWMVKYEKPCVAVIFLLAVIWVIWAFWRSIYEDRAMDDK